MKYVGCSAHSAEKKKTSLRSQFFWDHNEAIKNPSECGTDNAFK
jgi:hypothetical protein